MKTLVEKDYYCFASEWLNPARSQAKSFTQIIILASENKLSDCPNTWDITAKKKKKKKKIFFKKN